MKITDFLKQRLGKANTQRGRKAITEKTATGIPPIKHRTKRKAKLGKVDRELRQWEEIKEQLITELGERVYHSAREYRTKRFLPPTTNGIIDAVKNCDVEIERLKEEKNYVHREDLEVA
ncbi:hypothetical protein GWO43_01850 [candidate division KSB1 bacterium]|nr:hypothetical protein [candidate division KSB1 bacterium]NIR69468.1 hypothetical protein [candidate division KSB1 bacterium]NIS22818.1 hypothetical protein [candidate division KSB1 bacterium]NIT69658.1 hypothetical protein [candidate division KSB1 bacterium]NIU23327.1 hypothetical protein [candidate division KSB1 bacterium]